MDVRGPVKARHPLFCRHHCAHAPNPAPPGQWWRSCGCGRSGNRGTPINGSGWPLLALTTNGAHYWKYLYSKYLYRTVTRSRARGDDGAGLSIYSLYLLYLISILYYY